MGLSLRGKRCPAGRRNPSPCWRAARSPCQRQLTRKRPTRCCGRFCFRLCDCKTVWSGVSDKGGRPASTLRNDNLQSERTSLHLACCQRDVHRDLTGKTVLQGRNRPVEGENAVLAFNAKL